jgi:hypothetical protein
MTVRGRVALVTGAVPSSGGGIARAVREHG